VAGRRLSDRREPGRGRCGFAGGCCRHGRSAPAPVRTAIRGVSDGVCSGRRRRGARGAGRGGGDDLRPRCAEAVRLVRRRRAGGGGATIFARGEWKVFGWSGGGGLEGTAKGFEGMGCRPGETTALAAGLSEAAGGASLALGLATPAGAAAVAGAMGVAAEMHSGNGFFNTEGGLEYPALIGLTAASIAVSGPGRISLDELTCYVLDRPWIDR